MEKSRRERESERERERRERAVYEIETMEHNIAPKGRGASTG
jgi:hypothetical protein